MEEPNLTESGGAADKRRRPSLTSEAARGVLWNFIARFGQQGIQFLVTIVLARLLFPEDFGLIGMVTVFIAVSQAIADGGFGKSLIQKQDVDRLDESSMFFFNLAASCALYAVLFFAAPWVAWVYQAPELTLLLQILGLNVIISAFGMVQFNVLTRAMRFRALLTANWTATLASGVVGITLALVGYGVWSLVGQMLSMQSVRCLMLWWLDAWRPAWQFSWVRLRRMLPFGSNLLLVAVIEAVYQNLFLVVIGLMYSKAEVGYYKQAHSLQALPMGNFLLAINHVMFPAFARVQDDPQRLKRGLRQTFRVTAFVMLGMMCVLLAVADPLIPVLMSEKWRPAIPYLRLLCLVGILVPLQSANLNAFRAIGRSDVVLRIQLIRKGLTVIALAVTASWGVQAMIVGQIGALALCYLVVGYVSMRLLDYRHQEQWQDLVGNILSGAAAGGLAYAAGWIPVNPDWLRLGVQLAVGGFAFISTAWALRLPAWSQSRYLLSAAWRGERRLSGDPLETRS